MYWPHGVPRVYAVNGPDIAYVSSDEDRDIPDTPSINDAESLNTRDDEGQHSVQQGQDTKDHESRTERSPDMSKPKWENEAIKSVCVSRSGQMFATISESSIVLWQTRVSRARSGSLRGRLTALLIYSTAYRSCNSHSSVSILLEHLRPKCITSNAPRLNNTGCTDPEWLFAHVLRGI